MSHGAGRAISHELAVLQCPGLGFPRTFSLLLALSSNLSPTDFLCIKRLRFPAWGPMKAGLWVSLGRPERPELVWEMASSPPPPVLTTPPSSHPSLGERPCLETVWGLQAVLKGPRFAADRCAQEGTRLLSQATVTQPVLRGPFPGHYAFASHSSPSR